MPPVPFPKDSCFEYNRRGPRCLPRFAGENYRLGTNFYEEVFVPKPESLNVRARGAGNRRESILFWDSIPSGAVSRGKFRKNPQ